MSKNILIPIHSDFPSVIPHVKRVADFMQFAKWFATPQALRDQKTQKEFATTIGVDEDTVTDWKRNPYFWPIAQQFMSEWIKERIPNVLNGLYCNASGEGKAKDVESFLRLGGIMAINVKKGKKIVK